MDMGPAYQAAVKAQLPEGTIVLDRFLVMKLYSDVIRKVRKTEFRKADAEGKEVIKGGLYLLRVTSNVWMNLALHVSKN